MTTGPAPARFWPRYAAIPSPVLDAVAGGARHLVVGPMSATAALSAAGVAPFANGESTQFIALTAFSVCSPGWCGLSPVVVATTSARTQTRW